MRKVDLIQALSDKFVETYYQSDLANVLEMGNTFDIELSGDIKTNLEGLVFEFIDDLPDSVMECLEDEGAITNKKKEEVQDEQSIISR